MVLLTSDDARRDLSHIGFAGKVPASRAVGRPASGPTRRTVLAGTDPQPSEFIAWLLDRAGLDAAAYRGAPLERRLPACLRVLKMASPCAARALLERKPHLLAPALSRLLIGVTGLFREPEVYAFLRAQVLPAWSARGSPLRVWSAACSTGDELYSMAMLLADAGLLERSFLLGTDCRADAIAQARLGLYEGPALTPIDPVFRNRYFQSAGLHWRPVDALLRRVEWKVADVLAGVEAGPWDVIFWRNAAMYLNPPHADEVWRQLASVLSADGVLVVGKAERPPHALGLAHLCRSVYRAEGNAGREWFPAPASVAAARPRRFA